MAIQSYLTQSWCVVYPWDSSTRTCIIIVHCSVPQFGLYHSVGPCTHSVHTCTLILFLPMFSSFPGNSFVKFGTLLNVSFVSPDVCTVYVDRYASSYICSVHRTYVYILCMDVHILYCLCANGSLHCEWSTFSLTEDQSKQWRAVEQYALVWAMQTSAGVFFPFYERGFYLHVAYLPS